MQDDWRFMINIAREWMEIVVALYEIPIDNAVRRQFTTQNVQLHKQLSRDSKGHALQHATGSLQGCTFRSPQSSSALGVGSKT